MRLFKEDNFNIVIDPEAKIIPEYKKIITREAGTCPKTIAATATCLSL